MTTSAIIILSALLGGSICVNIAASASKKRLVKRFDRLKARIEEIKTDHRDENARYFILQHTTGICSVYRFVSDTNVGSILIKKFDTTDSEYNHNEATELVETLEKTLCYD